MNNRSSLVSLLAAVLAVHPVCVLAASYHSEPNPIGEKVYGPHLLHSMLPLGLIACALFAAWLLCRIRRKVGKQAAEDAEAHHC